MNEYGDNSAKGWQELRTRRGKQRLSRDNRFRRIDGVRKEGRGDDATSFFFTEFPDHYGAKDMWSIFQRFGRVFEVFIPNKRDKRGKRFGFVRFFEVSDP